MHSGQIRRRSAGTVARTVCAHILEPGRRNLPGEAHTAGDGVAVVTIDRDELQQILGEPAYGQAPPSGVAGCTVVPPGAAWAALRASGNESATSFRGRCDGDAGAAASAFCLRGNRSCQTAFPYRSRGRAPRLLVIPLWPRRAQRRGFSLLDLSQDHGPLPLVAAEAGRSAPWPAHTSRTGTRWPRPAGRRPRTAAGRWSRQSPKPPVRPRRYCSRETMAPS